MDRSAGDEGRTVRHQPRRAARGVPRRAARRRERHDDAYELDLEAGQPRPQSIAGARRLGFNVAFNRLAFNVAVNNPLAFNMDVDLTDYHEILAGFLRQSAICCCSRACRMCMMACLCILILVGIIWLFVRGPSLL